MRDVQVENNLSQGAMAKKMMLENALVFLVKGQEQGRDAWVYVRVKRDKLPLLKHDATRGFMDISSYGEKLCAGWGKEPPQDVRARIKREYGV